MNSSLQNKIYDVNNYCTLWQDSNLCYYLALDIECLDLDSGYYFWYFFSGFSVYKLETITLIRLLHNKNKTSNCWLIPLAMPTSSLLYILFWQIVLFGLVLY